MRHAAVAVLLLAAVPAAAQYAPGYYGPPAGQGFAGQQPQLNYLPNYYNRQTQPLSPYLNLLRGGNPGVNYYYGVRPGLPSGGLTPFGTAPGQPFLGPTGTGYLPQASIPYDPDAEPFVTGGQPVQLRSAGHPAFYGNQFNGHGSYQSVYFGAVNRGGFLGNNRQRTPGAGGSPAAGGLGTANRPATPAPRTR